MSDDRRESYDQMCERIAYSLMQGFVRGEGAVRICQGLAHSVLMWRKVQDDLDKAEEKKK